MYWNYGIPMSGFPSMNAMALEDKHVLCVSPVV